MFDLIIVGIAVVLSFIYVAIKVVRNIRRPAGSSSACGCSSTDCSNCPMIK